MSRDDVELGLVVDSELFRIEAIVRWLDAADARLKKLPPPNRGVTGPRRRRIRLGVR